MPNPKGTPGDPYAEAGHTLKVIDSAHVLAGSGTIRPAAPMLGLGAAGGQSTDHEENT